MVSVRYRPELPLCAAAPNVNELWPRCAHRATRVHKSPPSRRSEEIPRAASVRTIIEHAKLHRSPPKIYPIAAPPMVSTGTTISGCRDANRRYRLPGVARPRPVSSELAWRLSMYASTPTRRAKNITAPGKDLVRTYSAAATMTATLSSRILLNGDLAVCTSRCIRARAEQGGQHPCARFRTDGMGDQRQAQRPSRQAGRAARGRFHVPNPPRAPSPRGCQRCRSPTR